MKTIATVTDIHANSTVAVCPPKFVKSDGDTHGRNKTQRWIWDCLQDFCQKVGEKKQGELIVVSLGEMAEKDYKYQTLQLISRNDDDAKRIGVEVMEPLVSQADYFYACKGTPAHVNYGSSLDSLIADDFDNVVRDPATKNSAWPVINLKVEGVKFNLAHYVRMGSVPWTQKNYANIAAAEIMMDCASNGEDIPDIAFRGHQHRWADSYDHFPVRCVIHGCWTSASEHILNRKPNAIAQIGGSITYVDGNKYEIEKIKYKPEPRKWSVIK